MSRSVVVRAVLRNTGSNTVLPRPQENSEPARVVLIQDNPLLVDSLKAAVGSGIMLRVVSATQMLSKSFSADFSKTPIFVIDSGGLNGSLRRLLRLTCQRYPDSRRILLGSEFLLEDLVGFFLEGVHGFVVYAQAKQKLTRAIQSIQNGRLWLSMSQMEQICVRLQQALIRRSGTGHLTSRQGQILSLVQKRLSNKEIASELCISENTVKFHLGKMFSKAGIRDRNSLADLLPPMTRI